MRRLKPLAGALAPGTGEPTDGCPLRPTLRRLVWLYFWLLIFEGAVRKWVLPQLAGPLLIVRDPLVLLIYGLSIHAGIIPHGRLIRALGGLLIGCLGLLAIQMLLLPVPTSVLVYGLRTFFLHLPLIFFIPLIFKHADLERMGRTLLVLAVPMASLMAYQFHSPADAWINRAPGSGEAKQLLSALGKVRPPATFSFSTGAVSFFGLATAFLLYALKEPSRMCARVLLVPTGLAVMGAMAVSGSRSLVISCVLVGVMWILGVFSARQVHANVPRFILMVVIGFAVMAQLELFREGTEVLSTRWGMAAAAERAEGGMVGRLLRSLLSPLGAISSVSFFGSGLGVGTNVGATLLTGRAQFLLSEDEWGRIVLELGPVLGLGYILWRVSLVVWLGRTGLQLASSGNVLPLLLFAACASNILTGQIAQPTTLGFTVLVGGLALVAIQHAPAVPEPDRVNVVSSRRGVSSWSRPLRRLPTRRGQTT